MDRKAKARVRARKHYKQNRAQKLAYQANAHLQRTYGLSTAERDKMIADREGRCDICQRIPDYKLYVDHDHQTGKVRGLLCASCNSGLGLLGDTIVAINAALKYLKGA